MSSRPEPRVVREDPTTAELLPWSDATLTFKSQTQGVGVGAAMGYTRAAGLQVLAEERTR